MTRSYSGKDGMGHGDTLERTACDTEPLWKGGLQVLVLHTLQHCPSFRSITVREGSSSIFVHKHARGTKSQTVITRNSFRYQNSLQIFTSMVMTVSQRASVTRHATNRLVWMMFLGQRSSLPNKQTAISDWRTLTAH